MRFWFAWEAQWCVGFVGFGFGSVFADGDPVDTWPDLSGNGLDAIQTVGGRQPTYKTNILNGYPVVRFDGNHEIPAEGAFPITGGQWTSFAVASRVGTTGNMCIASSDTNGEHRGPKWAWFADDGAYATAFNTAFTSFDDFGGGVSADTFYLISAVRDGSSVETFLNGVSSGGSTATTGTPEPGVSATPLFLGSDSGRSFGTQRLIGDIAEVIGYPTALSSTDRQAVEAYLAAKYAL
jgi:hypothetical protein